MDPLIPGLQALLAPQSARCHFTNVFQVTASIGHLDFLLAFGLIFTPVFYMMVRWIGSRYQA
jgi:hypothetical protein